MAGQNELSNVEVVRDGEESRMTGSSRLGSLGRWQPRKQGEPAVDTTVYSLQNGTIVSPPQEKWLTPGSSLAHGGYFAQGSAPCQGPPTFIDTG